MPGYRPAAAIELVWTMLSYPEMGPSAVRRLLDPRAGEGMIAINLAVADVLGREIPPALVNRAKYVVCR